MEDLFQKAIQCIQAGDRPEGKALLARLIQHDPDHEMAWLWMSATVDEDGQRRQCLQQVLRINPENRQAAAGLAKLALSAQASPPAAPVTPPSRELAHDETFLEEPALEEPALEEPALEEPALEEPALEEPLPIEEAAPETTIEMQNADSDEGILGASDSDAQAALDDVVEGITPELSNESEPIQVFTPELPSADDFEDLFPESPFVEQPGRSQAEAQADFKRIRRPKRSDQTAVPAQRPVVPAQQPAAPPLVRASEKAPAAPPRKDATGFLRHIEAAAPGGEPPHVWINQQGQANRVIVLTEEALILANPPSSDLNVFQEGVEQGELDFSLLEGAVELPLDRIIKVQANYRIPQLSVVDMAQNSRRTTVLNADRVETRNSILGALLQQLGSRFSCQVSRPSLVGVLLWPLALIAIVIVTAYFAYLALASQPGAVGAFGPTAVLALGVLLVLGLAAWLIWNLAHRPIVLTLDRQRA